MANLLSTSITGTLSTTGNTGIGTTSPGEKLDVNGNVKVGARLAMTPSVFGYSSGWKTLILGSSGTDYTTNATTITFGVDLSTNPSGSYTGNGGEIFFRNQVSFGTPNAANDGYLYPMVFNNGTVYFPAGNVGINTTNPTAKLEISGFSTGAGLKLNYGNSSGTIEAVNFIANGGANGVIGMQMVSAGVGDLWLGGSGGRTLTLYRDGNVGIGTTSPTVTLEVSGRGLITSSGSSDTFAVTHSSGSGIGVNITKGGNGEGLYVNKTSGTGNAVTIVGTLNATTLVKSGGTASQYLMADGSVSTLTNPVTGTGTTNYIPKFTSASAIGNSAIYDNAGNVGIGTTSPKQKLIVEGTLATKPGGVDGYYSYLRSNWSQDNAFELGISEDGANTFHKLITSSNFYFGSTLQFWTSDTEKMRITSAGIVLIGTTNVDIGGSVSGIRFSPEGRILSSNSLTGLFSAPIYADRRGTNNVGDIIDLAMGGFVKATIGVLGTNATTNDGGITFNTVNANVTKSERMRITSNGNVLINTTTDAGFTLDVNGSAAFGAVGNVIFTKSNGSSYSRFLYSGANLNVIYTGGAGGLGINNYADSVRIVQITDAGNVGIGSTEPNAKLTIWTPSTTGLQTALRLNNPFGFANLNTGAQIVFSQDRTNAENLIQGIIAVGQADAGTSATSYMSFSTNSTGMGERMRITSAGNVGIGTTSPGSKLSISGSNSGSVPLVDLVASGSGAFQRGVRMLNSGMVAGDSIMYSAGQKDSSKNMGQFYFHYAGDESNSNRISMGLHSVDDVFNITGAGNVGIGTTSPAQKLDVRGFVVSDSQSNGSESAFYLGNSAHGLSRANLTNDVVLYTTNGDVKISGNTAAVTHLIVKNGGNVGIGTTSPSDKLDVSGNARTSGYVLVNNHSDNTLGYRIANTSGTSVSAMFTNSSNQLVIAAGAVDQINLNKKVLVNAVALGVNIAPSATAGRIDASNDIVAFSSSDERLKDNITPIANALDKVKSLTGVEFDWKPEHKEAHGHEGHDTGIIAQQVLGVMPSAVRTNDTGYLAVRYEKLIGLLIEANKELAARVEELEKKIG
jgi:hypothetical protein